jgi:dihydroorotate dehydrogenase
MVLSSNVGMGEYLLVGNEIESPLVNAAGSVNGVNPEAILREVDELAATGIGAVTIGSFTVPPQAGNEARYGAPVYYHDAVEGKTYNSMGLPNIGVVAAASLSPEIVNRVHDAGKVVVYSGSPTNSVEHGSAVDQAARLAYELLATDADLVEINVSCPNIVINGDSRKPIMGYDLVTMMELVERLHSEVGQTGRLGVKLPPYLSQDEKRLAPRLAKIIQAQNIFRFIVTPNTIPNQVPLGSNGESMLTVPGGRGGLSGPATKDIGRAQLTLWRENVDCEIISTLGVDSGQELHHRRQLGAVAAGGVTFLWQSKNWKATVTDMLTEFAALQ